MNIKVFGMTTLLLLNVAAPALAAAPQARQGVEITTQQVSPNLQTQIGNLLGLPDSSLGGLLGQQGDGLLGQLLGGNLNPGSLLNGSVLGSVMNGGGLSSLLGGSPLAGLLGGGEGGLLTGLLGGSPLGGLLSGGAGGLLGGLTGGGGLGGILGSVLGGGGGGGLLGGLLGGGGLTGIVSMIPGMQWLAAAGPMMGAIMDLPVIGNLLGSIPGVSQLLGFLGMGTPSANLGPLVKQINDTGKFTQAVQNIVQTSAGVASTEQYKNMAGDTNHLMKMVGSNQKFTSEQVKNNPKAVAQAAEAALTNRQRENWQKAKQSGSPMAHIAAKEANNILDQMKLNAQRNASNAAALQAVKKTATEANKVAAETTAFRQETASAVKNARKTEDLLKLSTATQLEQLRVAALNSAALTSALANQTAVEVAQAETLNSILQEIQTNRLGKAEIIMNQIEAKNRVTQENLQKSQQYTENLAEGVKNNMDGSSIKGIDLMGDN
ncbi:hypothetical protein Deipr_2500 (plasmid) [Deinococcus proteolyticus MRP]|uniref:Uncharacterized protein n=1 Tax=Deinococcus proteolyticus (strain ATCC 35074 / DSM 20540 / JCM 6276 / NBRC 101906 / NCIMB 13154 / VKM Ac-1939 / CCM 2703 / MRP) TaxID=693977 RepID=F0RQQ8_DEIPM|nr:hypothetical protein [Deinococcus proteolyticus]ADY27617.1 hypothetical protein Deipr_2500 [Deinococcus proteolyticus MRP]